MGADATEHCLCLHPHTKQLTLATQTLLLDGVCWNWSNYWLLCDHPQKRFFNLSNFSSKWLPLKYLEKELKNSLSEINYFSISLPALCSTWVPAPAMCSQSIPRNPQELLSSADTQASQHHRAPGRCDCPVLHPTPLGSVASSPDISTISTSPKTHDSACICVAGGEGGRFTFSPYVVFPFKKYQNHPMEISTKQLLLLLCSKCTLPIEPGCSRRQIWVLDTMLNSESHDRYSVNICGLNEWITHYDDENFTDGLKLSTSVFLSLEWVLRLEILRPFCK